jgi:1,4-dihydroxy-2-naphthoyl-CoA synthase
MPESQTTTTMVANYQNILFDIEGQIASVTLNRPQRRNAPRWS